MNGNKDEDEKARPHPGLRRRGRDVCRVEVCSFAEVTLYAGLNNGTEDEEEDGPSTSSGRGE